MQELEDGLSMLEGEIEDKEHATQLMRWVLGLQPGEKCMHAYSWRRVGTPGEHKVTNQEY